MGDSISSIAIDNPGTAYNGELTFVGALRKYLKEENEYKENVGISKRWNGETTTRHIADYQRRLIPAMNDLFGKEKPLSSYTEEDFELVLDQLNKRYHYDDSTLLHYRHLLWVVYRAGFEHELFPDGIFWDDVEDPEDLDEETKEIQRIEKMTRIKKSFDPEEELRLIQWILSLDPRTASGEDVGLLLMYATGWRNNEICGANYACVRELPGYGLPVLDMLQSTELNSNKLKAGGKTGNAPRTIPLLKPVYDFLLQRKHFLEGLISTGELKLPAGIKSVEQLPVVCVKDNYTQRTKTADLSIAGRKLFEKIGISKSELVILHQILCSREFRDSLLDEKEPTTYLFRRHCATTLFHLGFSLSDIQYWMGHEIEDPSVSRSDFDMSEIARLAVAYQEHPLNILWGEFCHSPKLIGDEAFAESDVVDTADRVSYDIDSACSEFVIDLKAREPFQPITVLIKSEREFQVEVDVTARKTAEYSETVDIRNQKREVYKKKEYGNEWY